MPRRRPQQMACWQLACSRSWRGASGKWLTTGTCVCGFLLVRSHYDSRSGWDRFKRRQRPKNWLLGWKSNSRMKTCWP